ncbi:hypothetical protein GA0115235_12224 [Streptomyces sp. DpondAA-F4a]|nr:hypothetical protein GA0115235_12224 [Streptomyces sp. DpondAA-F4a]
MPGPETGEVVAGTAGDEADTGEAGPGTPVADVVGIGDAGVTDRAAEAESGATAGALGGAAPVIAVSEPAAPERVVSEYGGPERVVSE